MKQEQGLRMAVAAALTTLMACASALEAEPTAEWRRSGEAFLQQAQHLQPLKGRPRNVILFVGDGMGVATVTAARIFEAQRRQEHEDEEKLPAGKRTPYYGGEENFLSFERFPYLALSRTYSANQQVSDSAPTMTAMVTGVKTNDGLLSMGPEVKRCAAKGDPLPTLLELAEDKKLATGIVTTARITHATPAALYAHTSNREWEGDDKTPTQNAMRSIARQLVDFGHGDGSEVLLGGGRQYFYCKSEQDPEYGQKKGKQEDCDLVKQWRESAGRTYVWNRKDFLAAPEDRHLLGLFEPSHMKYEADRGKEEDEPSLKEMTQKAIAILGRNPSGYFLMVEAGRIDHGHHAGNAYRALADTVALSDAVRAADELTSDEDTLIIVTADHSHVFTMAGYPERGNFILGLAHSEREGDSKDLLGLPYTTLGYANGPGYAGETFEDKEFVEGDGCGPSSLPLASAKSPFAAPGPKNFSKDGKAPHRATAAVGRSDLNKIAPRNFAESENYLQEVAIPMSAETHGGEDVAIYAKGPAAHWVHGSMEQHALFYIMAEALGLRTGKP